MVAIINYPYLRDLKWQQIIILQFYWSEVQHRSQRAGIKVLAGLYSFQEAPGEPLSAASIPWFRETPLLHPECQQGGLSLTLVP